VVWYVLSEDEVRRYVAAGEIAWRVKEFIRGYVRPGVGLLDIAVAVESRIRELGGEPAFPTNISVNSIAAHKTPLPDEYGLRVNVGDVVKVDVGVHVDGYIADTAVTLVFNDKLNALAEAAEEALVRALKVVGDGVKFSKVGEVIEDVARKYGFKPVRNLSGHSLGRFAIHAGDVIPNFNDRLALGRFKRGNAYAVEPFISNGVGYVIEADEVDIYAFMKTAKFRGLTSVEKRVAEYVLSRFKTLPFCERWLADLGIDKHSLRITLRSLASKHVLHQYPVLIEADSNAFIAQFEETVVIADGVLIITNPKLLL